MGLIQTWGEYFTTYSNMNTFQSDEYEYEYINREHIRIRILMLLKVIMNVLMNT